MVRTTDGDFILDNLSPTVLLWNQTGYRFIKRESDSEVSWVYFTPVPATDNAAKVAALFH